MIRAKCIRECIWQRRHWKTGEIYEGAETPPFHFEEAGPLSEPETGSLSGTEAGPLSAEPLAGPEESRRKKKRDRQEETEKTEKAEEGENLD